MRRTRFDRWPCSIARTVDLIGDWWTPLILRDAYYGATRFDDFQSGLGVGRNVLSDRLRRLVDEGLFERIPYQEKPPRFEYRLTPKGLSFLDVLLAMLSWGDDWMAGEEGPPIELYDQRTGQTIRPQVIDANTGDPIRYEHMGTRPGPGFPEHLLKTELTQQRLGSPRTNHRAAEQREKSE